MKRIDLATVESEIRKEKAEALGRAGERLERALRELQAMRQESLALLTVAHRSVRDGEAQFPAEVEQMLAEYARLCEHTTALRQALIIQREAVGLWRHEDVDRQYPLPGPLPLPMVTPDNG
jgi:hypothetical protein